MRVLCCIIHLMPTLRLDIMNATSHFLPVLFTVTFLLRRAECRYSRREPVAVSGARADCLIMLVLWLLADTYARWTPPPPRRFFAGGSGGAGALHTSPSRDSKLTCSRKCLSGIIRVRCANQDDCTRSTVAIFVWLLRALDCL
jgi:hypothetical protein